MQHRIATCLVAVSIIAAGCKEKSSADLAKDAQKASGDVVEEQKDVRTAEEKLDKSRDAYQKETRELDRARKRADEARSDLAKRAREDSAAIRSASPASKQR
jgi:molecular chaperone GrpE (heat shock protein)